MSENKLLRCTKYPAVSIPEGGFFEYLYGRVSEFGSNLALVETKSGKRLTYSEVFSLVERVAYHLYRHGVRKGDVFALCAANSVNYVILILALARLGAVCEFINALSSPDDMKNALSIAGAKYLFTTEGHSDGVRRILSKTSVKAMFVEDSMSASTLFERIPPGETPPPVERVLSDDLCGILMSSGTSGLPKAVGLTNRNFICTCLLMNAASLGTPEGKACLIFQPLSHIFGIGLLFSAMVTGAYTVLMSQFDFKLFLELVAKYKVERIFLVPPVMVLLVKSPLVAQYDLSSVKEIVVGAAPVIDTTTGTALGPNQAGEICVQSDQLMRGYVGNQSATRQAIDQDGWYRTGDVGYYDENGYIFIVDRLKELIKYNAYQVAPAELEGLLLDHPDVADVGVIGLPDESHGELPHAWIVRKPGSTVTEQDIIDFVAGKVSPYKKLRGGVKFVTEIPKSASGKILRRIMKSRMTTPDAGL